MITQATQEPLRVCLDAGGPLYKISVNGRILEFELNQFAGPNILNKRGEPLTNQPTEFLRTASLWLQQGRRMDNGLCRWDTEPKEITEHMGGKHYRIIGYTKSERGS